MKSVHRPKIDRDLRGLVATHGPMTPDGFTIHDAEAHDIPKSAQELVGIANFWKGQGLGYGAHLGIDGEGTTALYADFNKVTWHTGGHNTGKVGVELIGFATFTRLIWWVKRPRQMHQLCKWMAWMHVKYKIPLEWSTDRGQATHRMFSQRFPEDTTHTDPGAGFPKRRVMRLARRYAREGW